MLSPDGRYVYSTSLDSTLKQWDLEGNLITTLDGGAGPLTCAAIAPNGRQLVFGSADDTLRVYDLDSGRVWTMHGRGDHTFFAEHHPTPAALRLPTAKQKILFLAANPTNTNRLVLEAECVDIETELDLAGHGADFEFRSKWRVSVDEMARHLIRLRPTIVHFSGHGRGHHPRIDSTARDIVLSERAEPKDNTGIYLDDGRGGTQLVTGRGLALMVASAAPSVRVVVLNACYTDAAAEALCQVVDCVVGMSSAIDDDAARSFAVAFYRALGYRFSVGGAVKHAIATLTAKNLPDACIPRCRARDWIDPNGIMLWS